ncbi:hypothetical protein OKA04_12380 [Luteolibacter flavescens]|uniref:Uncharacterized protein n=1 Tax=Luteolibacter flavescens TaxID=1859460 RepID=A0ABT3FPN8_9BACT|nr:hypothetical protein [Luteolibacter flavescens]MCW1885528.1 hypothetical protein [Luteolibacter flavescens]
MIPEALGLAFIENYLTAVVWAMLVVIFAVLVQSGGYGRLLKTNFGGMVATLLVLSLIFLTIRLIGEVYTAFFAG